MKKCIVRLSILIGFFLFGGQSVYALTIKNIEITPNKPYLRLTWDVEGDTSDIDGYAIQWSKKESDISVEKYAKQYTQGHVFTLRLRSFDREDWYYFRIYTYKTDERKKVLSNGSKIVKWRLLSGGKTESSLLDAHDPVIVKKTETKTDNNTHFDFGKIQTMAFDTFADLWWSKPIKMVKSDYDGFYITLAKKPDLTDVIKNIKVGRTKSKIRIKGLSPNTTYYVRGAFYKETRGDIRVFGIGSETKIKVFKTIEAIDRNAHTRASRNIKKIEKKSVYSVDINDKSDENNKSNSGKQKTTTEKKETESHETSLSDDSIKKRILAIKNQIQALQKELSRLESQLKSSSKSPAKKKRYARYKRVNIRELLKKRLKRRHQRRKK